MFQSHIGSIKARRALLRVRDVLGFQSHIGSIKAAELVVGASDRVEFQSHIGSIKATLTRVVRCIRFRVSIPHWFD